MLFLESFIVAAVASVLAIRWFLALTGFPKLGDGGVHIAHMLWGGALMLVALLLLFAYLDRPIQHVAAIVAGLGFGTFIDEIGKFVTADNDYFFRPAVALIYVVLVALFIAGRTLVGNRALTQTEALANALDLLEVRLARPLEGDDRARIEHLLAQADQGSELVTAVGRYLDALPPRPDVDAWWETIPRWFAERYHQVALDPRFSRLLSAAVIVYTVAAVVSSMLVLVSARRAGASADRRRARPDRIDPGGSRADRARRAGAAGLPRRGVPMVPARHPRLAADHPGVHLLQLAARAASAGWPSISARM